MAIPITEQLVLASHLLKKKLTRAKRFPLLVEVEPLFACNLECAGCGKIQYPPEILKKRLSVDQVLAAVEECGAPMVSIAGGEPLIHPEIDEMVRRLLDRGIIVFLCTNALLLEKKMHLFEPHRRFSWTVHVDGLRQRHDAAVCRDGVFDKAVAAVRAAKARGFQVTTNTTFFKSDTAEDVRSVLDFLNDDLGVDGMMIPPGFAYEKAPKPEEFLTVPAARRLFREAFANRRDAWRLNQSPLFLDFLEGKTELECTPWAIPSYSIFGWQRPCYLMADGYAQTYRELLETTDWEAYGRGKDPRCANCMAHCGYEPTAVLATMGSLKGIDPRCDCALMGGPMESSGHAFGKVILAGEHAVVYGVPALALGIDRGATARARALASGPSRLRVASWGLQVTDEDTSDLGRALASLLASVRRHQASPPVEVEAVTDLPAGGGLGCSAALGVAIARAVAGLDRTTDDVREHAMAWERVFHGNPSGVDTTVAVFGGVIRFAREEGRTSRVDAVEPRVPLVFAVGHSGTASSTRTMVESVARQRAAKPAFVAESFEGIRRVVTRATHAIEVGNRRLLGEQLDMNQTLLARLSLSTPAIDALCAWAREHGALGVKLTGAGGGGCVVALASGRTGAERILSAWEARSFDGFIAEVDARPIHTRCGQHGARGNPGEHDGTHVETSRLLQGQRRGAAGAHR